MMKPMKEMPMAVVGGKPLSRLPVHIHPSDGSIWIDVEDGETEIVFSNDQWIKILEGSMAALRDINKRRAKALNESLPANWQRA